MNSRASPVSVARHQPDQRFGIHQRIAKGSGAASRLSTMVHALQSRGPRDAQEATSPTATMWEVRIERISKLRGDKL